MGRPQNHNDRIAEGVSRRYADDPGYALSLSQAARSRWNKEYVAELSALNEEFEAGRLQRNIRIGLRVLAQALSNGSLDDDQKKLLRAMREIGSNMYNSADRPQHAPMRGSHSHTHAAFGHPVQVDGQHEHEHQHNDDNRHDQHSHDFGHASSDRPPGSDANSDGDGVYGRMMSTTSPVERRRMQAALRRQSEERRLCGTAKSAAARTSPRACWPAHSASLFRLSW